MAPVAASFGHALGYRRSILLPLQQCGPHMYGCRILSVLITAIGPCDRCLKSRLCRTMSAAPLNKIKQQRWQRELKLTSASYSLKRDMRKFATHQVLNVPNVITAARILATPYLAYLVIEGKYASALGLLAVTGVSDWLDGFIARKFRQESIFGSFLDPFADKFLVGTLSLSMMWTGLLPFSLAALILGRDFMLISGTLYYRLRTKKKSSGFFSTSDTLAFQIKPSMLSKVNTALQLSVFGLTLTNAAWQLPSDPVLDLFFGAVGMTTFLSGSEYLYGYMTITGAFKPISKAVLFKVVKRTDAAVKRTDDVNKSSLHKTDQRTNERLKR